MIFTGSDDMSVGIWNTQSWYYNNTSLTKKRPIEAVGFMKGHEASIEDLCILPNGILLSCAFDKRVIAWQYQQETEIQRYEKQEQLRCMDYIEQQSKLFVGTNNCNILTIDIAPLLAENDMQLSSPDPNSTTKKFYGLN